MSPALFPLDVVRLVLDELTEGLEVDKECTPCAAALRVSSLVCRKWRPLAQQRLLKRVVLVDSNWRERYDDIPMPEHPPLSAFLDTIKVDDAWVAYIQVLSIWGISDTLFPEILDVISQRQALRTFAWSMHCDWSQDCDEFPATIRPAVEAVLTCPKLTSVRILGACRMFPIEFLRLAHLEHLEYRANQENKYSIKEYQLHRAKGVDHSSPIIQDSAAPKAQVKCLEIEGNTSILSFYISQPDCRLDFTCLKELTIINFDELCALGSVLKQASFTIEKLTWAFGVRESEDFTWESIDRLKDISLKNLTSLKTLNLEAWMGKYFSVIEWDYVNFKHYVLLSEILTLCDIPKTLENLNISLEDDPFIGDWAMNELFEGDIKDRQLDEALSEALKSIISSGSLKAISVLVLVSRWKEALEEHRNILLSEYMEREDTRDPTDEGSNDKDEDLQQLEVQTYEDHQAKVEKRIQWMVENPGKSDDDFLEEQCRAGGCTSDNQVNYHAYKSLPFDVAQQFPLIQSIDIVHFEVMDASDFTSYRPDREIW